VDVSPSTGGIVEVNEIALSSYPETSTFTSGSSVQLKAIPASGYRFDYWDGDLSGITNPSTIVVDCNKKLTANFSRIVTYSLTMQINGSGSITPVGGNYSYEEGTIVNVTATPDSGWQFDGWSGDVANPNIATTTITMTSDKTLNANFSKVYAGWWLLIGIVIGMIIIGLIIWLVVRNRTA